MKDTSRTVRTSTSNRDTDRCLVLSRVYEEKVTEESHFHFTEDDEDVGLTRIPISPSLWP